MIARSSPVVRKLAGYGLVAGLRLAAILIGVVYVKVYTTSMAPEALSRFFYLTTASYLLNALIFIPFDFYLQAYAAKAGDALPLRPMLRLTALMLGGALVLAAGLGAALIACRQLLLTELIGLYLIAALLFGCTSLRNLLNNRGHSSFVAAMLLVESVGRVGAFLLTTLFARPEGALLFYSSGLALAAVLAILLLFAARKLDWQFQPHTEVPAIGTVGRTSLPISFAAAADLVQTQSYRLVYQWAGNPGAAAIFAVVVNVGSSGMAAASQIYSQILSPRLYASQGAFLRSYVGLAAGLTVAVALIGWAFSSLLIRLITSATYVPFAHLIVVGVLMQGANLILNAMVVRATLRGTTTNLVASAALGAVIAAIGYALALTYAPDRADAIAAPLLLSQLAVLASLTFLERRRR
ncbi:hypothetical protein AB2M62_16950 [Sphingomonas sp. MMS12-HWE2-04]|uniref:hypothetical protein n=1 Tax=Sphingomonas sp. MMS12-HWE2-04 TaxID=3234199 RepID=UPI00384DF978